jgi:DNA-binding transcriptional MerR regulator
MDSARSDVNEGQLDRRAVMAKLTIGEVSEETGLASSAIRYYEREGLIPRAPKEGGRRVYDPGILDRLAVIELAKQAGMTIRETKRLLGGLGGRRPAAEAWQRLTRDKLDEIDGRIERLEQMKHVLTVLRSCDCPTLDDCGRALRERGKDLGST